MEIIIAIIGLGSLILLAFLLGKWGIRPEYLNVPSDVPDRSIGNELAQKDIKEQGPEQRDGQS